MAPICSFCPNELLPRRWFSYDLLSHKSLCSQGCLQGPEDAWSRASTLSFFEFVTPPLGKGQQIKDRAWAQPSWHSVPTPQLPTPPPPPTPSQPRCTGPATEPESQRGERQERGILCGPGEGGKAWGRRAPWSGERAGQAPDSQQARGHWEAEGASGLSLGLLHSGELSLMAPGWRS